MRSEWDYCGYYNAALPGDETIHIAEVNWDGDPLRPLCKCSRSTKFRPVCGWVPRRRFCSECMSKMREIWKADE